MLVGTSGFGYAHWAGSFFPPGLPPPDRLSYFARFFRTVELNVTFYRMPSAAAFEVWRDAVPDDFVFAVKASRYLSHILRLRDPAGPAERLMERARLLGPKLGPVLLQLPPGMRAEPDRLEATLEAFQVCQPGLRVAVEPRDPSWFSDEVRQLLERRGTALCLADRRRPVTPLWRTAPWLYLRFHEGRALPRSCYGRAALVTWARRVTELAGSDPPGYAYFNNDWNTCAIRNARIFERALRRGGTGVVSTLGAERRSPLDMTRGSPERPGG